MAGEFEVKGKCPRCEGVAKMRGNDPNGVLGIHRRMVSSWRYTTAKCEGVGQPAVAGSVDELLSQQSKRQRESVGSCEREVAQAQEALNAAVESNAKWQAFEAKVRRKMAKPAK